MTDPAAEPMICVHCKEPINEETEKFAALYGPEEELTLVGFLHEKCAQEIFASGTYESFKVQ